MAPTLHVCPLPAGTRGDSCGGDAGGPPRCRRAESAGRHDGRRLGRRGRNVGRRRGCECAGRRPKNYERAGSGKEVRCRLTEASRLDHFTEARPMLLSLAYRMLGTRADAEDVVQEAFLRWQAAEASEIASPRAYLATITARLALDHLKSARVKRETYVGTWLPEPLVNHPSPEKLSSPSLSLWHSCTCSKACLRRNARPSCCTIFSTPITAKLPGRSIRPKRTRANLLLARGAI